jgi:glycerol-3-phosphate acyltransferase PlsY
MYMLLLLLSMLFAYLAGSINFALLISRWARGVDIRTVGNKNPGTANVGREIGKGWAALVFAGDLAKGLVPLILGRAFFFEGDSYKDFFALILTGISAIIGHCWPLYFSFRGGGGLATSIGVYMFFIPVEFFSALVISFITVQVFFRKKKYAFGQLIPMIFVPLAPALVILTSLLPETNVPGILRIGGYPWHLVAGIILLSVSVFIINIRIVITRFSKDKPA